MLSVELVLQALHLTVLGAGVLELSIRQHTSAYVSIRQQALHLTVLGAGVLERMRLLLLEL
jgi:hypothetical protein